MTDREKLVAVLNEIEDEHGFICDSCGESKKSFCIENFADHLIANGVTVQSNLQNKPRKICPTTGLECIECVPGSPCAKEDVTDG